MDKINVKGVATLSKTGLFPVCAVVIRFELKVGAGAQRALPAAQQIAPCELGVIFYHARIRGRKSCYPRSLSCLTFVNVTLKRHHVAIVWVPIHPEPALDHAPVIKSSVVRMKLRPARKRLAVDSVIKIVSAAAVPGIQETFIHTSPPPPSHSPPTALAILAAHLHHRLHTAAPP